MDDLYRLWDDVDASEELSLLEDFETLQELADWIEFDPSPKAVLLARVIWDALRRADR